MDQKFIKITIIGMCMLGGLAVSSWPVNATGFHEGMQNKGIAISPAKFNALLAKTNTEQLGYNFGAPDEIQMLKNTTGERVGSVWVYHNAVQNDGVKQDASFMIINGKLQYATLSDVS